MNVLEEQRNILFEACKKIATDEKCPKWIADYLRDSVMKAKQVKEDFPSLDTPQETAQPDIPLQIGDIVLIEANNTSCVAKLVSECIPVDNIRLFDVQVVEGNKYNQKNTIFHNIPETFMRKK